jgi:integrase
MTSNGLANASDQVAPGVFRLRRPDGRLRGYRVFVRVPDPNEPNGRLVTKRFGIDTLLKTMKDWRDDQRSIARLTPAAPPRAPAVGFAKDAETYLEAIKAMPSFSDRARDITLWVAVFGETPRTAITTAMIRTQLALWAATKAASTVNHRRTALMHLWRVLDGRSAANPVKDAPKFREPDASPRGLPYPIIRRILKAVPGRKSRARLAVIAWTGLPHAQVAQLRPEDLNLAKRQVFVRGRQKGKGTKARAHPLTADGVLALRQFAAARAWGKFSQSTLRRAFRTACATVERAAKRKRQKLSLAGVRPYDLRHSYGSQMYAATGDIRATQVLMGHAKVAMTERYTLRAVPNQLAEAIRKFGAATAQRRKAG